MSGEIDYEPSSWTVDTLHAHFIRLLAEKDKRDEQRFFAQEKSIRNSLESAIRAVDKADEIQEKRLESLNKFREQQKDIINNMVPRSEAEKSHVDIYNRLENLNQNMNEKRDHLERRVFERISDLNNQMEIHRTTVNHYISSTQGRSQGLNAGWAYLIALISFISIIISIVLSILSH